MTIIIFFSVGFAAGIILAKFWTRWRNAAEAKLAAKLGK